MKNKFLKTFVLTLIFSLLFGVGIYAAILDPTIPSFNPDGLSLDSDGTAKWVVPAYTGGWKRFDIQLMERKTTQDPSTGLIVYNYKTKGSVRTVDPNDQSYTFTISSEGYYQFQIRGVNLEGNYGEWKAIYDNTTWASQKTSYPGVSVTEDDISAGGGSHTGGISNWTDYYYGPGVINQGVYPYGYQNQYQYNPYYQQYPYNQQNPYNPYNQQYQYPQPQNPYYPNQGYSNYPIVPSPYGNNNYGYNQYSNNNGMINPNYSNSAINNNYQQQGNLTPNYNNNSATPQISQALEIGWHVDTNGRFYYQGNGVVLKGTWYFIDGSYYRFSDNGYILANQWFRDNTTGYWYYLGGDGKMLVGWQCINGVWYYFKPENGNGFGTMYMNTSLQINDPQWGTGVYAFDANGAMVRNAWFGGFYYGSDGNRKN